MLDFTQPARLILGMAFAAEKRAASDPERTQRRVLASLLHQGSKTVYGKEHNFADIKSYEEFAARVPVNSYEVFRPYVMRMLNGERDVLWPGRCRKYAQSSGTSDGKSKYIPLTGRCLNRVHYLGAAVSVGSYLVQYPDSHLFAGKSFALCGSFANELHDLPKGVRVGDLSATLIKDISVLANYFRVPDKHTALLVDWRQKLPRLVEASRHEDVRSLSGVPSWFLTLLREVVAAEGVDEIHKVWPHLEVFFHGGISFEPYRQQYSRIAGGNGMRFWENYNASEGFFGVQYQPNKPQMRLLMSVDIFYELEDTDTGDVIPVWEAVPGKVYALLITSSNGLWRYQIGDTVMIHSTNPVTITVAGRTKHYINAFGEEVMVYNTDAALAHACAETGAQVADYTAAPVYASDKSRGRHQWVIEFSKMPTDMEEFEECLDRALQAENSDYQAKRTGNIFLDRLSVTVARPGLFHNWLAETGKLGGQRKVPRLSNDRKIIDRLLDMNASEDISPIGYHVKTKNNQ